MSYPLAAHDALNHGRTTSWHNMGFWLNAEGDFVRACQAMVDLVGEEAKLQPGDRILDLAFGAGDSLLRWPLLCPSLESISGVTLDAAQFAVAQSKLPTSDERRPKYEIKQGDGMRWAELFDSKQEERFDALLVVDGIYHFPSRSSLLRSSLSHLKPGARVVYTDFCIPSPSQPTHAGGGWVKRWALWAVCKAGGIPWGNMKTLEEQLEELGKMGCEDAKGRDITEHVFPGLVDYILSSTPSSEQEQDKEIQKAWVGLKRFAKALGWLTVGSAAGSKEQGGRTRGSALRYVLVRATVPVNRREEQDKNP